MAPDDSSYYSVWSIESSQAGHRKRPCRLDFYSRRMVVENVSLHQLAAIPVVVYLASVRAANELSSPSTH